MASAKALEVPVPKAQHPKNKGRKRKESPPYFLSAAEADASQNATRTAGHLRNASVPMTSDDKPASPNSSSQPLRRKGSCASCAHLIARAGQPFQCRIFSVEYAKYKVEHRETLNLDEGRSCPYFMRVTSGQIEDILRRHDSSLAPEQVREYAHDVEEQVILSKTIAFSQRADMSAEEVLREELLRYLVDGYSIVEATVTKREEQAENKHSKDTVRKVRLRLKQDG